MDYAIPRVVAIGVLLLGTVGACGEDPQPAADAQVSDADAGILNDDLSMPLTPTVDSSKFMGSATCGGCHTQHYDEWKSSMHSYAMIDPVYRAAVKVRQADREGREDRFCLQCHSPIGTRSGDIQPGFDFEALEDITLEGVNCETCHSISEVQRPFNAGLVMDVGGPFKGPIQNPESSPAHDTEFSELFSSSKLCASCHDVVEVDGLNLERPYQEWLESPAAQNGVECQTCHMATYRGKATNTSVERDLHEHYFVGVDMPLESDFLPTPEDYDALRGRIANLLTNAATITLEAQPGEAGDQLDLYVSIHNNIVAHNIPTGSTFNRQVWLEVIATDADNNVLYETGTLDGNGDLRNYWSEDEAYSDHDLIEFGSRLTDIAGNPTVFSWRATEHHTNSLSPLYDRTSTLFIPTSGTTNGPVHVEARLRFRSFPPYLLRALGLSEFVGNLEVFDIDSISIDVDLLEP